MSHDRHAIEVNPQEQTIGARGDQLASRAFVVAAVSLVLALLVGVLTGDRLARFFHAYLVTFAFFLSISLGGLFFVLINHVCRAGWSVTSRRICEVLAASSLYMAVLFAPIFVYTLVDGSSLYPWTTIDQVLSAPHGEHEVAHHTAEESAASGVAVELRGTDFPGGIDPHTEAYYAAKKGVWFSKGFFAVRWIVYFGVWALLGMTLWRLSVRQDVTRDPQTTLRMEKLSAPGLVLFALTLTAASMDLLMALSPAWFSTMYGVYYFSGAIVALFATLILALMGLQRMGFLKDMVTDEHYHDLGKFLFAFVFFWGYIAFSQYMLLWYASLPETVFWLAARGATTVPADVNGWSVVLLLLLFGHFLIPFAGLMSRHAKRNRRILAFWSVWLLVFHWLDLWWMVMPELGPHVPVPVIEVLLFVGMGALCFAAVIRKLSHHSLVPCNDPRLDESLAFENL